MHERMHHTEYCSYGNSVFRQFVQLSIVQLTPHLDSDLNFFFFLVFAFEKSQYVTEESFWLFFVFGDQNNKIIQHGLAYRISLRILN